MAENSFANAKQLRMAAVQEALKRTKMVTAKVWNPWPDGVADKDVDLAAITAPVGSSSVPEVLPDNQVFSELKRAQLISLGAAAGLGGAVTAENLAEAKKALRKKYVQVGRANYRSLESANCTLFACCVIGMLADQPNLLGRDVKVELLNLPDLGGGGHAYVVVGRADGDYKNLKTYGQDCFVIDIWYARQQSKAPGTSPVKDLSPDSDSPFWDLNFYAFLDDGYNFLHKYTFVSQELAELR